MKTLVIDTATPACSVALFGEARELISGDYVELGRGHAERLVPMISQLPERGRADRIFVNVGPGSFTGIRVGISAARALALAWEAECHGYGCLPLLAAMAETAPVDVATQGGHGEFFFQSFDASQNAIIDPRSLKPESAAEKSSARLIVGSAAEELAALRDDQPETLHMLPDARQWPKLGDANSLPPAPLYLRGADAKLPGRPA